MARATTKLDQLTLPKYFHELGSIFRLSNVSLWILIGTFIVLYVLFMGLTAYSPALGLILTLLLVPVYACYFHQYLLVDKQPSLGRLLSLPALQYFFVSLLASIVIIATGLILSLPIVFVWTTDLSDVVLGFLDIWASMPHWAAVPTIAVIVLLGIVFIFLSIIALFFGQFHAWHFSMLLPHTAVGSPYPRIFGQSRTVGLSNYLTALSATLILFVPFWIAASIITDPIFYHLVSVLWAIQITVVVATQNIMFKYWIIGLDRYEAAERKQTAA